MKHTKGSNSTFIPIGVMVSVVGVAFFVFMHFFTLSNNSLTDNDIIQDISTDDLLTDIQPTPSPLPQTPMPRPQTPLPGETAYKPRLTGDEYMTVQMEQADISRGYLLLINAEHSFEIPDDLGLVSVATARTVPYRVSSSHIRLQESIMKPFDDMMQGFIDETNRNIIYILSAFRDYASQRATLNNYIYLEGREAALRRAKEPGHSEHHTGLAVDFATIVDGEEHSFTYFDVTRWYPNNSYKYGFILRYARDKTDITKTIYEPWHFRYVGLPHSFIMHDRNWALEEYIDKIKDYSPENTYQTVFNGVSYEVFYTDNMRITVPFQASTEISGNNVDGFIVTIYHRYDRITNVSAE